MIEIKRDLFADVFHTCGQCHNMYNSTESMEKIFLIQYLTGKMLDI